MNRYLLIVLAAVAVGVAVIILVNPTAADKNAADKNPVVVMDTSMGTIKIELYHDKAPGTVDNFLAYVDDKFYDGTIFHRVIPDFMIQGGGFNPGVANAKSDDEVTKLEKPTKKPIKNESDNGLKNEKYTLAMARTNDPDSATAQFFINVVDNNRLNRSGGNAGYCVFGKVIEGTDVVDKIKAVKTKSVTQNFKDVPAEEVLIKSVRRADK
jgi:peptidyl-prolyl cis-trans isomerase A (cyclophilin A)